MQEQNADDNFFTWGKVKEMIFEFNTMQQHVSHAEKNCDAIYRCLWEWFEFHSDSSLNYTKIDTII